VLHLVNKNPELSGIPFIFLTAKSERNDFRKGMEMGADDYITKPFTDLELLNSVEMRLKKARIAEKQYSPDEEGLKSILCDLRGEHALETFAANRTENLFKKKQPIFLQGNHPQKLYYLKSGKVKVYATGETGKDLTLDLYSPGDFFGYTALLEQSVYHETAEALEDSVVVEIPVEEFRELLMVNPEVTGKFIRMLAKDITEKEQQLLNVAYNSLRKRVANALIMLRDKYGVQNKQENFTIQISREDLANIAGTATESLIRTLSDFKSENLIDIKNGKLVLTNEKKLENLLN
jgi:CRP-like cAMP-binding protein